MKEENNFSKDDKMKHREFIKSPQVIVRRVSKKEAGHTQEQQQAGRC